MSESGTICAECEACGWTLERSLDAAGLSTSDNREIGMRTARSHSYKCQSDGTESWGEVVDVDVWLEMGGPEVSGDA